VEVGPSQPLENLAQAREAIEINAAGRVVLPGFVDCHTHLMFPVPGLPADYGQAIRALHAYSGRRLQLRARAYLEAMARHGTTTVEVKTGCGPDDHVESKMLRVLSSLRYSPVDLLPSFLFRLPPSLNGGSGTAAAWVMTELLLKIHRRGIAQFADLAWDDDPQLAPYFDRYLQTARTMGWRCRIHADQQDPARAIEMAVRHGVLTIDHLEHTTEAQAALLSGSGIIVTLLPCAAFQGGQCPPARALIDQGVAVAIGTNFNPQHTPTLNKQASITMACWRLGLGIEEAITAATFNSAHALGCADRVGSIEPGKSADIVLLNACDYPDLAANLGSNLVHLTMKRGKLIYKEGVVAPRPIETLSL
jgi:imidazolonepropionase